VGTTAPLTAKVQELTAPEERHALASLMAEGHAPVSLTVSLASGYLRTYLIGQRPRP
jgi:hypothetical protein